MDEELYERVSAALDALFDKMCDRYRRANTDDFIDRDSFATVNTWRDELIEIKSLMVDALPED